MNPKVSILRQLEPRARYEVCVVADSDVKVGPDFLSRITDALADPGTGLVSCPYRSGPVRTLGAALEALTISADFLPSVAVARQVEGIRFALGAAVGLRREVLAAIGGFAAITDHLADDYQLGWLVHRQGLDVRVLPYVVETVNPDLSFSAYFLHQLRWTRTYRVCRPGGYLAYGVTHGLVFALALWAASGLQPWALGLIGAYLALRGLVALTSERFCLRGELPAVAFLLLPLKDLLAFVLWALSFAGHHVTWRGRRFRLTRDGKLVEIDG
jgi:ceramide glucosyltransferase